MKNGKRLLTLLAGFWAFIFQAQAQIGTIEGTVRDFATNEILVGANVVVDFTTKNAAADKTGRFSIKGIEAGTYTLTVSFIGYKSRKVENVRVEARKKTVVNVILKPDVLRAQEVEVLANRLRDTEISVISDIKNAEEVATGISSEQIQKSQDVDAAQVVRRMSSTALVDDRFAIIRGLGERYNAVMINDALTPSMEVDTKAFSFDVIPVSIIDRIMIYKSGGAELPGEFAGGVIKVTTKDIPEESRVYFSLGSSYRNNVTFKPFRVSSLSATDVLGYDNKTRVLPSNFPDRLAYPRAEGDANKYKLPNNYNGLEFGAIPDLRLNLGAAFRFKVGKHGLISNISYLHYSLLFNSWEATRLRYYNNENRNRQPDTAYKFTDQFNSLDVRTGIIHNWSFQLDRSNKIEFRNLFNRIGKNETILREAQYYGQNNTLGNPENQYSLRFEERSIYSGQLNGTHHLSDEYSLKWLAGYSVTERNEPDWKRLRADGRGDLKKGNGIIIDSLPDIRTASRFFSNMKEEAQTLSLQLERILDPYAEEEYQSKIRMGMYYEDKSRDFDARWFSYRRSAFPNRFNPGINGLPYNRMFDAANQDDTTGLILQEGTQPSDAYTASSQLMAGFISTHLKLKKNLWMTAGFRGEFMAQNVSGFIGKSPFSLDYPLFSPLPSVNLTWSLKDNHQLRAGYFVTVNRASFRELAPFSYYDFSYDLYVFGNPNLQTATIHNGELRYEWYPQRGSLFTVGGFYKKFFLPIEQVLVTQGNQLAYTYANAKDAFAAGVELEIHQSLKGLFYSHFFDKMSFIGNVSLIHSRVTLGNLVNVSQEDRSRPLTGQAPYLINAGIYYNDEQTKTTFNFMYNVFGPRVFSVGNNEYATLYEMPRHVIDLNVNKRIKERYELRLTIQDLFNAPYVLRQDSNRDSKIDSGEGLVQRYRRGTWVTLTATYKIY